MPYRYKAAVPPGGPLGFLAQLPVRLHRRGWGRLLGSRVLILTHTGRVSGRSRHVALEVVDQDERGGSFLVASGFGVWAQWYRNIDAGPAVTVHHAGRRFAAVARPLSPNASGWAMADCAQRRPRTAKRLMRMGGLQVDGTTEDYFLVGRDYIPFIRLVALKPAG